MRPLLPPATAAAKDPLYGVLLERAAAESRPRHRTDLHLVALVVEGGGMRGAVAAGMRTIGFTGASHSWPGHGESLMEAGATTVIRRLGDFPAIVEALREWRPEAI